MSDSPQIVCTKCRQLKPIEQFHRAPLHKQRYERFHWCKVCVAERNREYRLAHSEEIKAYHHKRWVDNVNNTRERHRLSSLERYEKARKIIRERYGDRCACCGEVDDDFLTLDHTNGDGAAQRKALKSQGQGVQLYLWLIRNGLPDGYRTLCYNCNSSCGTDGHCAHEKHFDPFSLVGVCG